MPAAVRAARISASENISLLAAQARVEASDKTRQTYLMRYYQVRWDDPELYDLIINTARLSPDQSAQLICQCFQHCLNLHPNDLRSKD